MKAVQHWSSMRTRMDQFENRLPAHYLFNGQDDWFQFLSNKDEHERGDKTYLREFHYIRFDSKQFLAGIRPLMRGAKSFIDVGCGGGDKLALIQKHFKNRRVYGVEHDPAMAAWAGCHGTVYCCDAMMLDYSPYDVIYAYWPIADRKLMNQLVLRILGTMHDKAVFAWAGYDIWGELNLKKLNKKYLSRIIDLYHPKDWLAYRK